MKNKTNILQLFSLGFFFYCTGALAAIAFPVEFNSQIVGIGVLAIVGFMMLIYTTFNPTSNVHNTNNKGDSQ